MKIFFHPIALALTFSVSVSATTLYSFKCGNDMFMCPGLARPTVCNNAGTDRNGQYLPLTSAQCSTLIAATKTSNTFSTKCPNNRAISHYVKYSGGIGTKTEPGKTERCSCPSGTCGTGGSVGGDPHFRTYDGTLYSFHGQCDLVMVKSPAFGSGIGLEIQARTEIVTSWSLVSNAAIKIGNDVFEVANDGTYYFNGAVNVELPFQMAGQFSVEKEDNGLNYSINLNNGESIRIINHRKMLAIKTDVVFTDAVGMMGSSGKSGLVGRDGVTVFEDAKHMGFDWQVRDDESMLFHTVRAPQFPATCEMPTVSSRRNLRTAEEYESLKKAQDACSKVHAQLQPLCIDDVVSTGHIDSATLYENGF